MKKRGYKYKPMKEKARDKIEGKENVFDVIDDAAQVIHRMPEGMYYDVAFDNTISVIKSSGTTMVAVMNGDVIFTVECMEDEDHMGRITSIGIQNRDKKTDLYIARGFIFRYDNGIRGERGRLMMHRLIEKLQTCIPCQYQDIRTETASQVRETTSPVAAFEHLGY